MHEAPRGGDASGATASVDPAEVAKFEAMAADWWDPKGRFRPLHALNPLRLDYIAGQIDAQFDRDRGGASRAPFAGLDILDVGCGGGLLCEPLARLGAAVTGIDAAPVNVEVARHHATGAGLSIAYRATTAEALVQEGARYDVVLAMEVIEHVTDPAAIVATCAALLKPGGLFLCSTLNRTPQAFALAVVGAERVLRWLPPGTHDWAKFVTPDELDGHARAAGLDPVDRKGMVFDPLAGAWRLSATNLSVNYVTASVAPG